MRDCRWLQELAGTVSQSLYIGPFRNAITEGFGKYYDLRIGTAFIEDWDQWKTGSSRQQNNIVQELTRELECLFRYEHLEINASPDKKALQAIINRKSYRLRELGAGLAQFLIVLGNVAMKRPKLLLIDEPELNLHPALQARFLTTLARYVSGPIMFATHSIGLARTTADQIYSFSPTDSGIHVRPFADTANLSVFLGEMAFSTYRELGYSKILLVEGVNEVKTFQEFLRKLKKDHEVVVVPLGGNQLINGSRQHELVELKRLCDRVAALIDSERTEADGPLPADRQAFVENCRAAGIQVLATEKRAIENYFTDRAIKAAKGESYSALAPHAVLKEAQPAWGKEENWRIAGEMTKEELEVTDVGKFLGQL